MKLFILGIDSLDRTLLHRLAPYLPAFNRLLATAQPLPLRTTFPPDSDTAWATLHTGLNPAQHGILRFIDPLQKSYEILNAPHPNTSLYGCTFWDLLNSAGCSTCAVFPHLAYPLPPESLSPGCPTNFLTARSPNGLLQFSPPSLLTLYPSPPGHLSPSPHGLPSRTRRGMQAYSDNLARLAASDAQFALRLLRLRPYDLFFAYFSTLDAISHFFWPSDSSPNEPSPGSPLFNAYRLYDRILASFLDALHPATPFILLSDHGHGPRPLRLFNVNELLRRNGFLTTRPLARSPHRHLLDRSRRFALRLVNRFALARPAAMLMRRLPCLLQPFTRPAVIDWDRTLACATDLSGIKAYSYGGIRLNPTLLPSHRNDQTRSEIIRLLQRDCRLPDGTSLIQFALPREELLQGPYLDLYPDILIQLVDGYGLGWGVNLPLFTLADAHNIVPGSHRADTGVFVYRGDRLLRPDLTSVDLLDITPSILDLFGVPPAFPYDGRSIFSPLSPDSSS